MFDHVTIRVSDLAASRRFYDLALGEATNPGEHFTEWGDFGISQASAEKPVTQRLHVAFGVRFLKDVCDERPEMKGVILRRLEELLPQAAEVFCPPESDDPSSAAPPPSRSGRE